MQNLDDVIARLYGMKEEIESVLNVFKTNDINTPNDSYVLTAIKNLNLRINAINTAIEIVDEKRRIEKC
jgi:hypothetical protein